MDMRIALPPLAAALAVIAAGCGVASHGSGAASRGGSNSAQPSRAAVPSVPVEADQGGGPNASHPVLQATLQGARIHAKPPYGPPKVTVTFTIHEPGKPPDTHIPFASYFEILLYDKAGRPSGSTVVASGARGRYSATTFLPPGGIGGIMIGGWLNFPTGQPTAKGGFFIPVTVPNANL